MPPLASTFANARPTAAAVPVVSTNAPPTVSAAVPTVSVAAAADLAASSTGFGIFLIVFAAEVNGFTVLPISGWPNICKILAAASNPLTR